MNLYVIKSNDGRFWNRADRRFTKDVDLDCVFEFYEDADNEAEAHKNHLVELVEKPEHYDVLRSLMQEAFQLGDKVEKLNQALCDEQDSHKISDVQRKLMHRQLDEMTSYWDTLNRRIADLQGQLGEEASNE